MNQMEMEEGFHNLLVSCWLNSYRKVSIFYSLVSQYIRYLKHFEFTYDNMNWALSKFSTCFEAELSVVQFHKPSTSGL